MRISRKPLANILYMSFSDDISFSIATQTFRYLVYMGLQRQFTYSWSRPPLARVQDAAGELFEASHEGRGAGVTGTVYLFLVAAPVCLDAGCGR